MLLPPGLCPCSSLYLECSPPDILYLVGSVTNYFSLLCYYILRKFSQAPRTLVPASSLHALLFFITLITIQDAIFFNC